MSLWEAVASPGLEPSGSLRSISTNIRLADLSGASIFGDRLEHLHGKSVIVAPRDQLIGALCLFELDGVAKRLVLCPPGLSAEHLRLVARDSGADVLLRDAGGVTADAGVVADIITLTSNLTPYAIERRRPVRTDWVLLTSGTTGAPKLVLHTLEGLMSAFASRPRAAERIVWSTFYDTRRYGGLQILLRAAQCGSMVFSDPDEPVSSFLARAAAAGVTHISGTPSHWRRALMSGASGILHPRSVRLSGEIADQAVLDGLRAVYPSAAIAHAFASTEAGVAFEVADGRAGFPASLIDTPTAGVELKVVDGTLRIRSPGNASCYLGAQPQQIRASDGYVDTGDQVELRDGRYFFVGRSGGVINVGGQKVHPEEVESVVNSHPWVRMSLVRARRNPITGAVVTAEVVLADPGTRGGPRPSDDVLRHEILENCRKVLPAHKVPAMVRIVPSLEVSSSGKLVRGSA